MMANVKCPIKLSTDLVSYFTSRLLLWLLVLNVILSLANIMTPDFPVPWPPPTPTVFSSTLKFGPTILTWVLLIYCLLGYSRRELSLFLLFLELLHLFPTTMSESKYTLIISLLCFILHFTLSSYTSLVWLN